MPQASDHDILRANEPIRRTSLVDEIASQLKADVLQGRYAPGEVLPPERELAKRYGVTRTSLKHALVRMSELGLIATRHGVGSVVQDIEQSGGADLLKYMVPEGQEPEARLLREILEARVLIAGAFARLASRRRTAKDLARLDELLDELGRQRANPREAQRIENAFMRALARASGNRVFVFVTNSVSAVYQLDLRTYAEPFRDGEWLLGQLAAVAAAVRAEDETRAATAMEAYYSESARRIVAKARRGRGT